MKPIIKTSPVFLFRGNRNFINTASLYGAISNGVSGLGLGSPDGPLTINIRGYSTTQLDLFIIDPAAKPEIPENVPVDFRLMVQKKTIFGWLQLNQRAVTERIEYDETIFDDKIEIKNRILRYCGATPYTTEQISTSFGRRLLQVEAAPPEGHRWLCTKVDMNRPFPMFAEVDLELELIRMLGERYARCSVRFSGVTFGQFDFALSDK